ncbi:MAG: ornithine carbamoyltransferase [Kiritimatiellia bacterium]|jgi:ornithine carbamoyltransferase|nr:ornithine carbamoyltransferase [Kiritimatiellia bacterium]MDP6631765.1 ornithine carbamoyltransferase [Kiritimatiellia bacterium]MDP6810481.1 ornithine carbamoyltransferase [Kiritimatiellia bacterium]MDP7025001.1 ornithine carbamoyltransferase [Kiritimatiellia bacterium]
MTEAVELPTQDLKGRDWLTTEDWSDAEIDTALDLAATLKAQFKAGVTTLHLPHKTAFLIFFDKSTRTRNSFEAGITQLGGHAHFIDSETSQIAHGESAKDMGIILSSYGHGIAIRHDLVPGEGQAYMREVAKWAEVPVINMQCDVDHPCQTLADLMTIREEFGPNLRGRKVAVSWAYAPSYMKPMSVPQGLLMLMSRCGMDVVLAHPPEYGLMPEVMEKAVANAHKHDVKLEVVDNMAEAFEDADVVYPKSWGCLDLFHDPDEAMHLAARYKDWTCTGELMKLTKKDSIYMHCLPADRGYEVTDAVIDGPHSRIYPEAENRLHTAKALMALTM